MAGPRPGGVAVRHALGSAPRRYRHRSADGHADLGRRDRACHDPRLGLWIRPHDVPRARAAVLDLLRASVALGADTPRRHRAARCACRVRRLYRSLLWPAPALRGAHLRPAGRSASLPRARRLMRLAVATLALLVVFAGCEDPYTEGGSESLGRTDDARAHGDNPPSRVGSRDTASGFGLEPPRVVVRAFCARWSNWDWRTINRQQRRLAALATGALGRELAADARLRAKDRALRRDRLGARGDVVAIDVK